MSRLDLSVDLGKGLVLRNPVMASSGTYGYGLEYEELVNLADIGAIVVKGISPKPRRGNMPPRIVETACGLLNSIGLQNPGVEYFLAEILPRLREKGATVIANVFGETEAEYQAVVERLSGPAGDGVAALEINVSCPNVKAGGIAFGTREDMLGSLIERLRGATGKHLMVKLSPNVTDITALAKAAVRAGADSLSAINTLLGLAVDLENRKPVLGGVTGGLSGPAIKPVALHLARQVAQAVAVPVVGIGGIANGRYALEFICVGCRAVQVGTVNYADATSPVRVAAEMRDWLEEHDISNLKEFAGTFKK